MTIQEMAQKAIDVQTACNLSGVVATFRNIVESMRIEHHMDTPTCNCHPVTVMFVSKLNALCGYDTMDILAIYRECERLAKEPTDATL